MKYPIMIFAEDNHSWSVEVPDLPGCFSMGESLEEAIENAQEAAALWLETVIDEGGCIPEAQPIAQHQAQAQAPGILWAVISVDLSRLSEKTERVNITLPSRILRRIDRDAAAAGESRSGFIARRILTPHS